MFGRLFGKRKQPSGSSEAMKPSSVLSMPLLKTRSRIDASAIAAAATKLCPSDPMTLDKDGKDAEGGFTLRSGNALVIGMHIPEKIPSNEVDECASMSFAWPPEEKTVDYSSHVILAAMSDEGPRSAALAATRVAAALMETADAAGWYVGNASLVHKPDVVCSFAKDAFEEQKFPVFLWVNVIVSQDAPGKFSASTIGLEPLGHREFEVVRSSRKPSDLMTALLDMANYVLDSGAVLKHGQTMGQSATEKWTIEIGKSKLGKEGQIIRIGIP